MGREIFEIAGKQYDSTKPNIRRIYSKEGFTVTFRVQSIGGRFRQGHNKVIVKSTHRSTADRLRATRKVDKELENLKQI